MIVLEVSISDRKGYLLLRVITQNSQSNLPLREHGPVHWQELALTG